MFRRGRSRKFWWGCSIYPVFIVMGRAYSVLLYASLSRHIIALSFVVFEELTVRSFCLGDPGWLVTYVFLMVAHSGFFKELVFIVVVVVFFHFIAGAKVHTCSSLSMTPFQWSQSWAEYQPALSNYLQLSLGIYLKNVNSSALSLVP